MTTSRNQTNSNFWQPAEIAANGIVTALQTPIVKNDSGNVAIGASGNANILVVTGTGANIAGTLNATGNVAFAGANVSLGAVGNLEITGGTDGQVLRTDGAGNLSWSTETTLAVTFQADSTTFPANARRGDIVIVTDTGTSTGILQEEWIFDGTSFFRVLGSVSVSGSVIDNTIGNSADITEAGRYIVPDTGVSGLFVGHENEYADFNGLTSTFTFVVPTADDLEVINQGPNAGKLFKYSTGTWTEQTTGALVFYNWQQSLAYNANDIVVYENAMYQANGQIPAGNPWIEGDTGSTWRAVSGSGGGGTWTYTESLTSIFYSGSNGKLAEVPLQTVQWGNFSVPLESVGGTEGVISGTGNIAVSGGGTVELSNVSTYTGNTFINYSSTLKIINAGKLPAGGTITLTSGGSLDYNATGTQNLTNTISGTGNIDITAGGQITLTANSTGMTGNVNIDRGNLQLGNVSSSGQLTSIRDITIGNTSNLIFNNNGTTEIIVDGNIIGTGGNVLFNGYNNTTNVSVSQHTLVQASFAGFTGNTVVNNDRLRINGPLGSNITLTGNSQLWITTPSSTNLTNSNITMSSNGWYEPSSVNYGAIRIGATANVQGNMILLSDTRIFGSTNANIESNVTGVGNLTYTLSSNSVNFTLSGLSNITGNTTLVNAKITANSTTSLSGGSNIVVNGSNLVISANSIIGTLAGNTGAVVNIPTTTTILSIGNIPYSTEFSGVISGVGKVKKIGATNSLFLTGVSNSTGNLEVFEGTVLVGNGSSLGGIPTMPEANISLNANLAFYKNANVASPSLVTNRMRGAGNIVLRGVNAANVGAYDTRTVPANSDFSGNVNLTNIAIQLSNRALGTSTTVVEDDSTLRIFGAVGGNVIINGDGWPDTSLSAANAALQLTQGSSFTGNVTLAGNSVIRPYQVTSSTALAGNINKLAYDLYLRGGNNAAGNMIVTSNITSTGGNIIVDANTVDFSSDTVFSTNSNLVVNSNAVVNANVTCTSLSGTGNVAILAGKTLIPDVIDTTFAGNIANAGTLKKVNNTNLFLTGNSTTSGNIIIESGNLNIGNAGTTGFLGNGNPTVTLTKPGQMIFDRSDNANVDVEVGVQRYSGNANITFKGSSAGSFGTGYDFDRATYTSYTGDVNVNSNSRVTVTGVVSANSFNVSTGGQLFFGTASNVVASIEVTTSTTVTTLESAKLYYSEFMVVGGGGAGGVDAAEDVGGGGGEGGEIKYGRVVGQGASVSFGIGLGAPATGNGSGPKDGGNGGNSTVTYGSNPTAVTAQGGNGARQDDGGTGTSGANGGAGGRPNGANGQSGLPALQPFTGSTTIYGSGGGGGAGGTLTNNGKPGIGGPGAGNGGTGVKGNPATTYGGAGGGGSNNIFNTLGQGGAGFKGVGYMKSVEIPVVTTPIKLNGNGWRETGGARGALRLGAPVWFNNEVSITLDSTIYVQAYGTGINFGTAIPPSATATFVSYRFSGDITGTNNLTIDGDGVAAIEFNMPTISLSGTTTVTTTARLQAVGAAPSSNHIIYGTIIAGLDSGQITAAGDIIYFSGTTYTVPSLTFMTGGTLRVATSGLSTTANKVICTTITTPASWSFDWFDSTGAAPSGTQIIIGYTGSIDGLTIPTVRYNTSGRTISLVWVAGTGLRATLA